MKVNETVANIASSGLACARDRERTILRKCFLFGTFQAIQ